MSDSWAELGISAADVDASHAPLFQSRPAGAAVSQRMQRMTLEDLDETTKFELEPANIQLGRELGRGAFGAVYKGKLYGKHVAVKKLFNQDLDSSTLSAFKKEVGILTKLRHPNVLLFMGACTEPGNLMIVTELMEKGSVYDLLHDKSAQLSFKRRMKMARQAALGMNYLHCSKPPFIHRDLKTSNLLVDENFNVKISDFGMSHIKKHAGKGVGGSYGTCGTPLWMAPEVLMDKDYDESADVYSFGIVLWELLTQDDPFKEIDTVSMMLDQVVKNDHRPKIPEEGCPTRLKQLIEACWQKDPTKRPPFEKIIPLFNQIIVDFTIKDKHGRAMWKKQFMSKDQLLESVDYENFVKGATAYFKTRAPAKLDEDIKYKALKVLLLDRQQKVSMEAFGRLLEWFGPVETLDQLLDQVLGLLKKSWFHGEISSDEAERLLGKEKKGTFLVRFSSRDPGSYAISGVSESNKIKHFRVYHKPGLKYLIGKSECNTLEDIISKYHQELNLKTACPGSPFEELFAPSATPKNQTCGYMVPEFE